MASGRIRARRLALWKQDPHCRMCGQITVLPESFGRWHFVKRKGPQGNVATIQHMIDRLHPLRGKVAGTLELWCWLCNQKDSRERQRAVGVEKLQQLSGRKPRKEK